MSLRKKLVVIVGIFAVFVVEGLWFLIGFLTRSIWTCMIASGIVAFTIYFLYVRLFQKKEARYPLVPPEGKADIYFPRTNIPRPIHADFRKMQEKKQKIANMKKKMRHKKK